jgi:hypothetical protein
VNCIKGCQRPCRCDECKATDEPAHAPKPSPATHGLLCRRCESNLNTWLGDVLTDTLKLDTRRINGGQENKGKHTKISGSPSLVRLEIVALLDPRTMRDEDDNPNEPVNIPGVLCGWAGLLAEEHNVTSPTKYMAQSVDLLQRWWDTVIESEWIGDFYDDMLHIRRLLNNAHQVERPEPVGHCLSVYEANGRMVSCARPLYASQNDHNVKCRNCGRVYNALDMVRVKVAEGWQG